MNAAHSAPRWYCAWAFKVVFAHERLVSLPAHSSTTPVRIRERPEEGGAKLHMYGGICSVSELRLLEFDYTVSWPLSMVVDDDVLQQYNQVTVFLMQVSGTEARRCRVCGLGSCLATIPSPHTIPASSLSQTFRTNAWAGLACHLHAELLLGGWQTHGDRAALDKGGLHLSLHKHCGLGHLQCVQRVSCNHRPRGSTLHQSYTKRAGH